MGFSVAYFKLYFRQALQERAMPADNFVLAYENKAVLLYFVFGYCASPSDLRARFRASPLSRSLTCKRPAIRRIRLPS